jgi:hypothetical protein
MIVDPKAGIVSAALVRRQKQLIALAWAVTMLPLLVFAYLTWQSIELKQDIAEARRTLKDAESDLRKLKEERGVEEQRKNELIAEKAKLEHELKPLRESAKTLGSYRTEKGIRIQFYRESDRKFVTDALTKLGFDIDTRLGHSPLVEGVATNTIAYGAEVSPADLRVIAVALVQAGFPLRRILPAIKQSDPKLIQITASPASESQCGLLTPEQIRAGSTCGSRQR